MSRGTKAALVALAFVSSLTIGSGVAAAGFEFGVKPSTGVQGSYFGFGLGEQVVLFGGLDFVRVSGSLDAAEGDAEVKATVLMPNAGVKFYLSERKEGAVAPYLLGDIFKASTSVDVDLPAGAEDMIPNEQIESAEDLLSPFGVNVAFGAEYYFSDNFSMLGEYGIRYLKTSTDLNVGTAEQEINNEVSASLAHHFIGFGVNFRF